MNEIDPNRPNAYELLDEYGLTKMIVVPKGRYTPEQGPRKHRLVGRRPIRIVSPHLRYVEQARDFIMEVSAEHGDAGYCVTLGGIRC